MRRSSSSAVNPVAVAALLLTFFLRCCLQYRYVDFDKSSLTVAVLTPFSNIHSFNFSHSIKQVKVSYCHTIYIKINKHNVVSLAYNSGLAK